MDLLIEKSLFLKRFEQVTDVDLIVTLNKLLEYALPRQKKTDELPDNEDMSDNYELSDEHKKILDERLLSYRKNPENLLSWNEVKKRIRTK
jgi:hypothetical protein